MPAQTGAGESDGVWAMSELRWILLIAGLALVAGVYLYTRWQQRRGADAAPPPPPREPRLDEPSDFPEPGAAPVDLTDEEWEHEVEPFLASAPETPSESQKIVTLHVMAPEGSTFPAGAVVEALQQAGLKYGRYRIFHRDVPVGGEARTVFSVADMMEPGTFDLTRLDAGWLLGVSLFMVLPGPRPGVEAFAEMLATARQLAERLGGEVKDASRSTLTRQTAHHIREEIIAFETRVGI